MINLNVKSILSIMDYFPEGIWVTNKQCITLYVNTAVCNFFGITPEEVIGKSALEEVQRGLSSWCVIQDVITSGKSIHKLITSKTNHELSVIASPVFDDNGDLVLVVATSRYVLKNADDATLNQATQGVENAQMGVMLTEPVEYIAESKKMKKMMALMQQAAQSNATIMILGESGVGKDGFAYNIHLHSSRKDKPFIVINCATLPENLVESELFGYEKGAFTDAKQTKIGLFEQANNGTIFLDEVGDLPISAQVKLLRCIQNREILRLGGSEPIKLNIRIVTATNQSLDKLIEKGRFREDLYYRLNVITLEISPIRERNDDIAPLAQHFLSSLNVSYDTAKHFSKLTLKLLQTYSWPGNVRELQNAVEHAFVLCPYVIISPEFLPKKIRYLDTRKQQLPTLKEYRKQCELEFIEKALKQFGSIREASIALGVNHPTLVRKLPKLTKKKNFRTDA